MSALPQLEYEPRQLSGSAQPDVPAFPRFAAHFQAPTVAWQAGALAKLIALSNMRENWDGYGAQQLRRDTAFFALDVLHGVMSPRTPIPQIVPSASGGVQLEWHTRDIDLEITISKPLECDFWFLDHRGESDHLDDEFQFASDYARLRPYFRKLTER